jgi:hypothetical protein
VQQHEDDQRDAREKVQDDEGGVHQHGEEV